MTISALFAKKKVFSFEVFPPKKNSSITAIYDKLGELSDLAPDFISVTYGAGGNSADNSTSEIASVIQNRYNITALAHLTCINSSRKDIDAVLTRLQQEGIDNILALRGDKNPDAQKQGDFRYASELIEYIQKKGGFSISGACYPEGHLEAEDSISDIRFLKQKVDAGASHLISQLFFDNALFYSFVEKARIAGITAPIQAGIMPVVNKKQIERMVSLCGVSLPGKFAKTMQRFEHNSEALRDAGIAYAVNQIIDLVANGVDGIHLYTMNNPYIARKISESIKNIIA